MLSDTELQSVQLVATSLTRPVTIFVAETASDTQFETNLINIARQISGVSLNRIKIEETDESILPGKPSLTLSDETRRDIHYLAAPEGAEFGPFMDAVLWLGRGADPPGTEPFHSLRHLKDQTSILVLMAALCPHCPQIVRNAVAASINCSLVSVTVVDAVEFSDLASRYKVKSTPTLIIDDGLTLVGTISLEDMVSHIIKASEPAWLTAVLESMINAGRAEDAARLICRRKSPGAIMPLYRSQVFATRMGALVAMEEALEAQHTIFDPVLDELTALLSLDDVSLRGDTAELLGKIGNHSAIPALVRIADDPNPDVREAVMEALALLQK